MSAYELADERVSAAAGRAHVRVAAYEAAATAAAGYNAAADTGRGVAYAVAGDLARHAAYAVSDLARAHEAAASAYEGAWYICEEAAALAAYEHGRAADLARRAAAEFAATGEHDSTHEAAYEAAYAEAVAAEGRATRAAIAAADYAARAERATRAERVPARIARLQLKRGLAQLGSNWARTGVRAALAR